MIRQLPDLRHPDAHHILGRESAALRHDDALVGKLRQHPHGAERRQHAHFPTLAEAHGHIKGAEGTIAAIAKALEKAGRKSIAENGGGAT